MPGRVRLGPAFAQVRRDHRPKMIHPAPNGLVGDHDAPFRQQVFDVHHEDPSSDAEHRGGVARSSDEGAVMALERRRNTVRLYRKVNRHAGGAFG
jgi:hypothetical protein